MSHLSDISTHYFTNLPPFSLADMALFHDTTEDEVRRVATSLNLSPNGPFETENFLKINRVLMPVPRSFS